MLQLTGARVRLQLALLFTKGTISASTVRDGSIMVTYAVDSIRDTISRAAPIYGGVSGAGKEEGRFGVNTTKL